MNSTSYDAHIRRFNAGSRADQAFGDDEPPELVDVTDPTEDLANDVTSELPGSGTRLRLLPPQALGSDMVVANDETAGIAAMPSSGSVLRDRYILEEPLGYGGTSVVSRARDLRRAGVGDQAASVAIKLLRAEFRDRPHCIARLRREFHQTQSIAHPNVVRFYDLDCDRGNWFIAMELLVGEPLGRRVRHECPPGLPVAEALRIAAACGDALAYAHDHGVTHGDVKPDNVFITASGEVRMLDFGVAPDPASQLAPAGHAIVDSVVGAATRAYASPEVLSGQAPEPRDDVFSLACMLYEMLAGRHPYGRRGADQAREAGINVERPPSLSGQQWHALAAGLAWYREGRPDVRQLLRAMSTDVSELTTVQEGAAVPVRIVQGQLLPRSSRKWRGPAVIGIAIALGVLIGRFAADSPAPSRETQSAGSVATAASKLDGPAAPFPADSAAKGETAPDKPAIAPAVAGPENGVTATPGLVTFEAASMIVSGRAVVAAIPVRHLAPTRRGVEVGWRVIDGSAIAGRDYAGPQAGVAKFAEGHTFRIIYVPIITDARATRDRIFTVELTGATTGASLGTARIFVTILGDA